jgi:hypothetical protein
MEFIPSSFGLLQKTGVTFDKTFTYGDTLGDGQP